MVYSFRKLVKTILNQTIEPKTFQEILLISEVGIIVQNLYSLFLMQ